MITLRQSFKIPILVHFFTQNGGRRGHSKIKFKPATVAEQPNKQAEMAKNNLRSRKAVRNEVQRDYLTPVIQFDSGTYRLYSE